jgi:hypothetical protein
VSNGEPESRIGEPDADPRPLAVTFVTTEHSGLGAGRWQVLRSVAGMVGVIAAVLTGSTAGLAANLSSDHSLVASLIAGTAVAFAAEVALLRFQRSAWLRIATTPLAELGDEGES